MFDALDDDNSGRIEKREAITYEKDANDEDSDKGLERTFVEILHDKVEKEKDKYDEFMATFAIDEDDQESMKPFFDNLDSQMWYSNLELQQKYLLRSIVIQTIKEEIAGDKKEDLLENAEKVTLRKFLNGLDMNIQLLTILALSPGPFKRSLSKEGRLNPDQLWLCELVESSRHAKFIRMISTAVD